MLAALAGALKPLARLHELLLPKTAIDSSFLLALHDKPFQVLEVWEYCAQPADGDSSTAADGACFPAALQVLRFGHLPAPIDMLAALPPVPHGLARIELWGTKGYGYGAILELYVLPDGVPLYNQSVPAAAAGHMRAAAALLAGRLRVAQKDGASGPALDELHLYPWQYKISGRGVRFSLPGPHASWLRELALLAGALRKVALVDMELCDGDLAALAAALALLQGLMLQWCSWPAAALMELASLERLSELHIEVVSTERLQPPATMAALQALVMRAPAIKQLTLDVPVGDVQLLQVTGAAAGALWPEAVEAAPDAGGGGGGAWRTYVYDYMLDALVATLQMQMCKWLAAAEKHLQKSMRGDVWRWALTWTARLHDGIAPL